METNKPATLCWKCRKACGGCSWSDGTFTPVPGWKAEKTQLHICPSERRKERFTESYHVIECPQFEDDTDEYNKPPKRNKWNSGGYMNDVY